MALNNISTAARNAMCDAFVDQFEVGTADASGDIQIYDAGFATLLAELTFSNPAFGNAVAGVATANAIASDASADNSGTAAVCRFRDRDNGTVVEGTVGTTGSGADIELNTVTIATLDIVAISSGTITQPAG